jgi:DNA primase
LLEELRAQPLQTTAQVLERWRERPEGAHLARLAAAEELVAEAAAAEKELRDALARLEQEGGRQRLDALLEKDRASGLSPEEKLELQGLTIRLGRQRAAAAPP